MGLKKIPRLLFILWRGSRHFTIGSLTDIRTCTWSNGWGIWRDLRSAYRIRVDVPGQVHLSLLLDSRESEILRYDTYCLRRHVGWRTRECSKSCPSRWSCGGGALYFVLSASAPHGGGGEQ